jgi:hypothetical protein
MPGPTIIAVDWSGAKKTNAKSGIWLAVIQDGQLVRSDPAFTREEAVALVQACESPVIAGFDFSFGVPRWFAERHNCTTIDDVWSVVEREGERWLGPPPVPPFWNDRLVIPPEQQFRCCEQRLLETGPSKPKSIFQLVGNGQVGAGSVRGMPHLGRLRRDGFAIWPFDDSNDRTVFEIYPSLLRKIAPHHDVDLANEHERDAVVSARVIWEHRESFAALQAATDAVTRIEGDVWIP